jgi:hypothetical protein
VWGLAAELCPRGFGFCRPLMALPADVGSAPQEGTLIGIGAIARRHERRSRPPQVRVAVTALDATARLKRRTTLYNPSNTPTGQSDASSGGKPGERREASSMRLLWPVLNPETEMGTVNDAVQTLRAFKAKKKLRRQREVRAQLKVPLLPLSRRIASPQSCAEAVGYWMMTWVLQLVLMGIAASLVSGVEPQAVVVLNVMLGLASIVGIWRLATHKHARARLLLLGVATVFGAQLVGICVGIVSYECRTSAQPASYCEESQAVFRGAPSIEQVAVDLFERTLRFFLGNPLVWGSVTGGSLYSALSGAVYCALVARQGRVQGGLHRGMVNPILSQSTAIEEWRGALTRTESGESSDMSSKRSRSDRAAEHASSGAFPNDRRSRGSKSMRQLSSQFTVSDKELESVIRRLHAQINRRARAASFEHESSALVQDKEDRIILEGLLQLQDARVEEQLEASLFRGSSKAVDSQEAEAVHVEDDPAELTRVRRAEHTLLEKAQAAIAKEPRPRKPADSGASLPILPEELDGVRAWLVDTDGDIDTARQLEQVRQRQRSRRSIIAVGGRNLLDMVHSTPEKSEKRSSSSRNLKLRPVESKRTKRASLPGALTRATPSALARRPKFGLAQAAAIGESTDESDGFSSDSKE